MLRIVQSLCRAHGEGYMIVLCTLETHWELHNHSHALLLCLFLFLGSLETGSNSPVSRTTNQSPLSMISTASTNSDLIVPDRPPPPYPGNSRQHNNPPPPHQINSIQQPLGAESSEPSEPEQVCTCTLLDIFTFIRIMQIFLCWLFFNSVVIQ